MVLARRVGVIHSKPPSQQPPSGPPHLTKDAPLRVMLVDDGAHRVDLIRDELQRLGHEVVAVVDSPLVIHDCVTRLAPDVVIIDCDSPSRDTLEHVATLSSNTPRPVVVFAEDDSDHPMKQAMSAGVSAYVVAGLQAQRLSAVLRVAIVRFEQDKALREQLAQAQKALGSRKRVERAKGILMQQLKMSEDAAFKHLRKLAMDRGETLEKLAERIIDAHSLLGPA